MPITNPPGNRTVQFLRHAIVAIACLAGCDSIKNSPRPLSKIATLDVYVVSASPVPGSTSAIDPVNNSPIFLVTPAIVSAADVATIQRSEDSPSMPSLTVNLTATGAKKLAAATSNQTGIQMAFVINGTVVAAPKLRSPIANSFRVTGGDITKNREQLFDALTNKPRQ